MAYLSDDQLREAIARYQGVPLPQAPAAPSMPAWESSPEIAALAAPQAPAPDLWAVPPGARVEVPPEQVPLTPAPVPPPVQPAPAPAPGPARAAPRMDPYQQAMADTERLSAVRADAVRGESEARAGSGERTAKIQDQREGAIGASLARDQARQQGYQATREQGLADYKRMSDEAANMSAYDRRTRGQRAMGALALGLSGLGDAIAEAGAAYGGQHINAQGLERTMQAIDTAVERDIQTQREQIANAKDRANAKLTELGIAREHFQDDGAAEAWTREAMREQYGIALQEEASQLESEVARLQGTQAGAMIEQDASSKKLDIWNMREDNRLQRAALAQRGSGKSQGMDWGQLTRTQLETLSAQGSLPADGQVVLDRLRGADAKPEKPAETKAQIPGYRQTQDVASGDATVAKKITAAARGLREDLSRLGEIRARNGGGTWNRNDVAEATQIVNGMAPKYSQMFGSGAPSTTELELFKSTLVNPTDYQFLGMDPIEAYARAADQITRTEQAQLGAYGYEPDDGSGAGGGATSTAPEQRRDDPMRMLKGQFGFRGKGR